MTKIIVFFIALTLMLVPAHTTQAATFNVCTLAELTTAITTANGNGQADTINFNCSTTLNFTAQLVIEADGGNSLTINANGNAVILDGGDSTRLFTVNAGASLTLNGLTLQDGNATDGGAIYNSGTLSISNSTLSDNSAGLGGAIWSNGTLSISTSTLSDNSTTGSGGAIYNSNASLTISNSAISNNSVVEYGGAIYNFNASMTISNSAFTINSAGFSGGAIYNRGTMTISTSIFTTNMASFGGAILNDLSIMSISDSTLSGNTADDGGVIYNGDGAVTINNSLVSGNSASSGGVIYNTNATVTINNSLVSGNSASSGGAIFNTFTSIANLNNSTLSGNSASSGGAIYSTLNSTVNSQDTHYDGDATNNTCVVTIPIADNGGNTRINSMDCPGTAPIALDVSAVACNGDNAEFTINAGDANFNITDTTAGVSITDTPAGLVTLTGPATWTNIRVTERRGEREFINIGGISCPEAVIIPPTEPVAPVILSPDLTALGCELTNNIDLANAPDNTYCRVLMQNGAVINYSGAVPAELISLGVILAVDVYRLEGGMSINTFPNYARVCLAGQGRLFYMDSRNAPRVSIELQSENEGGLTCGWIPAPGTLILTS